MEVPDALVASARHGLEVLLEGLGLEPRWMDSAVAEGLYYGVAPEKAPASALRIRMDPALTRASWPVLDAGGVSRLDWEGYSWPLLYPAGGVFGPPSGEIEDADVVASAHAWTSGRLEQMVRRRDVHGRLRDDDAPPTVVAAARPDLIDGSRRPAVDAYRRWLNATLQRAGTNPPGRSWGEHDWALIPTVDVDLIRTRRMLGALQEDPRKRALANLANHLAHDAGGGTFFLKAGAASEHDVGYALDSPALAPVWEHARAGRLEVGMHPSYFAHDHAPRLRSEWTTLRLSARRMGATVRPLVRTHYLRWTAPGTPRTLATAGPPGGRGFQIDSTLGFTARAGFRRATSVPFRLFDVDAERPLDLWEVPLAVMDTALFVHGGGVDAPAAIRESVSGAREAGGACVLLWHNEPRGRRAEAALQDALGLAREGGALVAGLAGAVAAWAIG